MLVIWRHASWQEAERAAERSEWVKQAADILLLLARILLILIV